MSVSSSSSFDVSLIKGTTFVPVEDAIAAHGHPNVKFVDGSWFLKGRNGREEFQTSPRIAGAVFFDIDDVAAPRDATPLALPHMMPSKELFAAAMDAMGISNDDHIIVYGSKDCMFVQRAWFQIRNMGHDKEKISMLAGSFADWLESDGSIEEGALSKPLIEAKDLDLTKPTSYQATNPQNVVDKEDMKAWIESGDGDTIVIDARAPNRYLGQVEEPRPNMRLGHMPNAKNVFFFDLLDPENHNRLKSPEELKKVLEENSGIDLSSEDSLPKRIITYCGSGATACAVVAALELCGVSSEKCYVYDGSWVEWGALDDTPIVKDGVSVP